MAWSCAACGFDLWIPVGSLGVSEVGFYDDGRFPGRCIVALSAHHEHLDEVPAEVRHAFSDDIARVGAVVRELTEPSRVNYAVLGNTIAHVHCHVIPRPVDDPIATRPPWEHPDPARVNESDDAVRLIAALRGRLI
jgi:diadenosine tetraphosphate (Ap4A) HIT family hydrolase